MGKRNERAAQPDGEITMTVREAIPVVMGLSQLPAIRDGKMTYDLGYIKDHLEEGVSAFNRRKEKEELDLSVIRDVPVKGPDGRETGKTEKQLVMPAEKRKQFVEFCARGLEDKITVKRRPIKLSEFLRVAFPKPPESLNEEEKSRWEDAHPCPSTSVMSALTRHVIME